MLRQLVCIVTLVSFAFSSILNDLSWATNPPLLLTLEGPAALDAKKLNVDNFFLPAFLGVVNDHFNAGDGSGIVINIQDAHCNYSCQMRISEILEYLSVEYGINAVNLEGGAGEYDLSLFTRIRDRGIRGKVADYFVKEGLVSGAEFLGVNNSAKARWEPS